LPPCNAWTQTLFELTGRPWMWASGHNGDIRRAAHGYEPTRDTGTGAHIAGELFKMMTGVDMVHVPYRGGGPALTDLIVGQVHVMFPATVSSVEYIRAGRLRALAVTTATRSELLPDIPTVSEFVPGYEASFWYGIGAPKNTPAEIVAKLNKEINAGLADPKLKGRLADVGGDVLVLSPADFGRDREVGQGGASGKHQARLITDIP
jgi:tripartite-type tricarboxylate transporter receptor subunit TctC